MKLVMVEWIDSYTEFGWNSKEDYELLKPTHPVSVGILIADSIESISLIQTRSNDQYTSSITIPKGCIRRIRTLKVV